MNNGSLYPVELPTPEFSIHRDAIADRIVANLLANDPIARQETTAIFILEMTNVAHDLQQMCELRRSAGHSTRELEATIGHAEKLIRDSYRKRFGTELGAVEVKF